MPVVTFAPTGRSASCPPGTSLLDAATEAGVNVAAPCGGEGVCGECRVQIRQGSVEHVSRGCLSPDELDEGWVLACSSRLTGDLTVQVAEEKAVGEARILAGDGRGDPGHAGREPPWRIGSSGDAAVSTEAEPLAVKRVLQVEPPSLHNSFSDFERLTRAIRRGGGPRAITAGLDVLQGLASGLREKNHLVTATIVVEDSSLSAEIIRVEPGDTSSGQLGLAIDIGTTTCVVSLVDVVRNHVLATAADYNGQLARGADIISRINYAGTAQRRTELQQLVLGTINGLIKGLCEDHGIAAGQIDNAVVAGNTTMIHLLLGMDSGYIRLAPYTPTVNQPPALRAGEVGLSMNPRAYLTFAPGVGSYVGGDITAGLLNTALAGESKEIRLFLDFGTNGEVVVGTGEWLMTCAASAGPAFEGSGVSCGMRACSGAIERVRIDPRSGRAEVTVIGGGRPRGLCGSGMIDLLAQLRAAGLIDPSGKLDRSGGGGAIRLTEGGGRNPAYTIVPEPESDTGKAITIDERDIQNLIRTKAAVYSACALMLKSVDLDFDSITEVYVAGGFGRFLDLRQSIMIGMLPDLPLERYTYLGNAAITGARAMLCDSTARQAAARLADRMTYLELNADPAYMSEYTAALFLPHTDANRFPTVKGKPAARHDDLNGSMDS